MVEGGGVDDEEDEADDCEEEEEEVVVEGEDEEEEEATEDLIKPFWILSRSPHRFLTAFSSFSLKASRPVRKAFSSGGVPSIVGAVGEK